MKTNIFKIPEFIKGHSSENDLSAMNDEKNELTVEIGFGLIPLVDENNGSPLLRKIAELRQQMPALPKIHIIDNIRFEYNVFRISGFDKKNLKKKILKNRLTRLFVLLKNI